MTVWVVIFFPHILYVGECRYSCENAFTHFELTNKKKRGGGESLGFQWQKLITE